MTQRPGGDSDRPQDPEDLQSILGPQNYAELQAAMADAVASTDAGRAAATVGTLVEPTAPGSESTEDPDEAGWWQAPLLRILPAWCQDRETAAQTYRLACAVAWNRTKFHSVRTPLYTCRTAGLVLHGGYTGLGDAMGYLLGREYVQAIKDAKRDKDHGLVLAHRDGRRALKQQRIREKGVIAALVGSFAYALTLVITAVEGEWVAAGPLTVTLLTLLLGYGWKDRRSRDAEYTLTDTIVLPANEYNETRLAAAVRNTGVIPKSDTREISVVGLIGRTADASVATFDLPPGIPASALLGKLDSFASALQKGVGQIDIQTFPKHSGRVSLHIADELPFTEEIDGGPLLDLVREGRTFDFFDRIPVGTTLRGLEHLIPSLVGESLLIGGEPGGGKSVAAFTVLLAAALSPKVGLWLVDGKGIGGNLKKLAPLADRYDDTRTPAGFMAVLDDLEAELDRRIRRMNELGEEKVTAELAAKHPELGLVVFFIDELKEYTNHFDAATAKEFRQRLISDVSLFRALGIITIACTQKPSTDVVPSSLRDLFTFRWALRCATPEASKTIIPNGQGFSAHTIESEQKGAGYLHAGGKAPLKLRSHNYTTDQIIEIIAWATTLRRRAGTLPAATLAALTGILALLREAFARAACSELATLELAQLLQGLEPAADWGRRPEESDRKWSTRAGTRLAREIEQALGRRVATVRVKGANGRDSNGYRATDLS